MLSSAERLPLIDNVDVCFGIQIGFSVFYIFTFVEREVKRTIL